MRLQDIKVLICDDSILVRKQISDILYSIGYTEISYAENGKEAVEKYKDIKPNIAFMDIVMPVMSGIEALKEITNYDPKAKVVIASSVITQSHLKVAIEHGAFDFIHKPIFAEDLKKIMNKLMKDGE